MTFSPATHAAAVSGVAFSYNNPGTISVENVTLSYGSIFFGTTVTTSNLLATIYTPSGTIGPVQPDGSFDNSYHYVELNSGQANLVGRGLLSSYTDSFNFATAPVSTQGTGTAGPLTVSAAANPHGVSINASGYHVTYDYTTQLTVPMNVTYPVAESASGINIVGTVSVSGNLVTDAFAFSHTFNYLPGDSNLDGTVNGGDLNIVLANYNRDRHAVGPGRLRRQRDGQRRRPQRGVGAYNQSIGQSPASTVPEPSAVLLLAAGAAGLLAAAWRRRLSRG